MSLLLRRIYLNDLELVNFDIGDGSVGRILTRAFHVIEVKRGVVEEVVIGRVVVQGTGTLLVRLVGGCGGGDLGERGLRALYLSRLRVAGVHFGAVARSPLAEDSAEREITGRIVVEIWLGFVGGLRRRAVWLGAVFLQPGEVREGRGARAGRGEDRPYGSQAGHQQEISMDATTF